MWTCTCDFAESMKLPCRHVMFYRHSVALYPVIPVTFIHQRWRRKST
ncbi:hypothetical protein PHMEG_0004613 [Phytophthora megakarya]|uniref:SWIM-type domain-containing protein n=1 Tax=Phytophthora megakarya TaxID=4795 RepID=A0A225WTD6_9STRA|nr:hypothetical protein PHMEG_0004613 [Phytophthora megakarya]